jgi:hypothetical protein
MPEDISKLADLMEIELRRLQLSTNKDTNAHIYGWEIEFVNNINLPKQSPYYRFNVFVSKDKNKQRLIEISNKSLNRLMNLVYFI